MNDEEYDDYYEDFSHTDLVDEIQFRDLKLKDLENKIKAVDQLFNTLEREAAENRHLKDKLSAAEKLSTHRYMGILNLECKLNIALEALDLSSNSGSLCSKYTREALKKIRGVNENNN